MSGFSRNKCLAFPGIPLLSEGNSVQSIGLRVIRAVNRPEGNSCVTLICSNSVTLICSNSVMVMGHS